MLGEAWAALGGDPAALSTLQVESPERRLPARLDVDGLAIACAGAGLLAAAELQQARTGAAPDVALDARHAAAAFGSERHMRYDGPPLGPGFAPLSRFAPTADGWIRTHANYPHHRAALLSALGAPADEDAVLRAIAQRGAVELEEAIVAAGGCAAAVRSPDVWAEHSQAHWLAGRPLVEWSEPAGAPGRALALAETTAGGPAAGLRVLDLTRVIAGPVATRTLAALGADVLRIDSPDLPELLGQHLESGAGKRSAFLDLRRADGRATFEELLARADVLVQGYRPGALAALGLDPEALVERHPHLVCVSLSAWGHGGPWGDRRGFDSLVQAASGIAVLHGDDDGRPGALPVQALDHGTGHLVAAAALRGLAERARTGRGSIARLALARTAAWLMEHPAPTEPVQALDASPYLVELGYAGRALRLVAPPGRLGDRAPRWRHGPHEPGTDPP